MLHFPNQSRVFDRTRRAVHFWGHNSAMEWSFFIGEDALKSVQPDMPADEGGFLQAFDVNRALIETAAMKAYERERRTFYELAVKDLLAVGRPASRK